MRYIFKFPDIGEGLEEGVIVEWHVEKGSRVKMGDSLVTMETDKVVTAIPSPKDGIIAARFGKVGETIRVGSALVEIEMEGIDGDDAIAEVQKPLNEKKRVEAVEEEGAGVVGTLEVAGNSIVLSASKESITEYVEIKKERKKALATPVARAMAKELGIDINNVIGTGPGSRVVKEDIIKHAGTSKERTNFEENNNEGKISGLQARVEIEPLSQIRKTIAKNMINSKHNAAHMTVFEEVEISELERVRLKYKEEYLKDGIKLTYLAFVLKAVALALKRHKSLNSEMDSAAGNMIYKKYYNIGVAIDTEKGLVVPVIKDVDKLSIKEIAAGIAEFSQKAHDGKLTLNDMKDGTFSVTSYGSIGGLFAVPVINYPQAAILGVGRVSQQPVIKDNAVVPGLVLPLSLSVDHRIADGGETARFINKIKGYLSDPISLIME